MTGVVAHHGVYAIFLLMIVAAIIPIGSELVMLYAGAVAGGSVATARVFGTAVHSHFWAFVWFAVAGMLGNVVGCALGWWIGDHGGRALIHRYGRFIHVDDAKLARAEARFDRYDDWAVPVGLATPLLRSFVAIPSGIVRVPFAKFLGLAILGCAVFCFGLGAAGWALGTAYTHAHHDLRYVEYAVAAGVLLLVAYLVYVATMRRRGHDPAR
ncbi:MAG: DedA family protein [Actinomycetota bacterium]